MSVSNSLLRGVRKFLRWRDYGLDDITVGNRLGITDLQPPKDSHKVFEKFFNSMKKKINVNNINIWALKLYFAIILLHIFPDGNGRVARNAYFTFKSNGLLDETKSIKRTDEINRVIVLLITSIIVKQFEKEGFRIDNFRNIEHLRAEKEQKHYATGYTSNLKYIAAKRVLQSRNMWQSQEEIVYGEWPNDMREQFEKEYVKVRLEHFWTAMLALEHWEDVFSPRLDSVLL